MIAHRSIDIHPRRCLACEGERSHVLLRIGPYTIAQCPRCLLAWTEGAAVEPTRFYDQAYFMGEDSSKGYNDYFSMAAAMERTNHKRIRRLHRLAPGARTLLDVGCGPGFFVKGACESGWQARGLDVSPFAARYGREQLGQDIRDGPLDEAHLDRLGGRFDVITLWDTIEHLHAPDETLRLLAGRLSPGGLLSLSTGDVTSAAARLSGRSWHLYNLPEHLWFFSVRSLRRLLRRAGLVVVRVEREICWYTAHYLVERLFHSLGRHPTPRLPVASVLRRLNVPVTLLDIVSVHARRRAAPSA